MSESTAVAVQAPPSNAPVSVFYSEASFASAQRMAKALTSSLLVPDSYRGSDNMGNALIAMDMASRMNLSPMVVMQNLHVISGRPSWSSQFIISALNSCGLFSPLRYEIVDLGEIEVVFSEWEGPKGSRQKVTKKAKIRDMSFRAQAIEKATGEVLKGPAVTYSMAVKEGWFFKQDSKWQTMGELMGTYRAAAFFGRLYAPHILNGMQTQEEIHDVEYEVVREPAPLSVITEDKPEGRARGLHAALSNKTAEESKPEPEAEKPKHAPRKKAAPKPTPEPEPEIEHEDEDAVDGEFTEDNGDMFGPEGGEDDDGDFQPA